MSAIQCKYNNVMKLLEKVNRGDIDTCDKIYNMAIDAGIFSEDDELFIDYLYQILLNRNADDAKTAYIEGLKSRITREEIFSSFLNLSEFRTANEIQ